ncbi:GNAT family N-acetyltransferase [Micromonospora cathayae]|uniref:GNAT family N-acetyltransferase n=1 Tax=Micromonospora cathayae TaxID=3028804 RepID=A0ABY7ZPQ0_9ACTN|nr:GNAT family N-acetyltransferase [Micromonospora sp. HUAS 3]WDZ84917.1 GNAT family N-acetyltransferase [Micromonospora sp. HUAS 3]
MSGDELRLSDGRVVLRPWADDDLAAMVALFDEPEIAFRVPVAAPFDLAAARTHLDMTRRAWAKGGWRYLVITEAGDDRPCGEVLLNPVGHTIGYVVGAAYRRRGLATAALRLVTGYAHDTLAMPEVYLDIEADNAGSVAVARSAGFRPADLAPQEVEDKGRRYLLHRWVHQAE